MNDVLLTVSGEIAPDIQGQIARKERPQADYFAMAQAFQADLLDYRAARDKAGWFGRFLKRLGGPNLLLAWVCFTQRRRYRVIFTDGEQIGLPLAFFLKFFGGRARPRHLMIVHILSVGKKMALLDFLGLQSHVDIFFTYSTWQKTFIQNRWHLPPERVVFTPFMVDADFYDPKVQIDRCNPPSGGGQTRPMICAVGLEARDYPTLIAAARGLDVEVVIAAGSLWSKRANTVEGQAIPENVRVGRFSYDELRCLYAQSEFMVVPLYKVNFQAGVTAILEMMSMGKAVICSRTPGQSDVVVEGETGLYVQPGHPEALRTAILDLLARPEEAKRMGAQARKLILNEMSLECYVNRLKHYTASPV